MHAHASHRIRRKPLSSSDVQSGLELSMSNTDPLPGASQPVNNQKLPMDPHSTLTHSLENEHHQLLPGMGTESLASMDEEKPKSKEIGHSIYHQIALKCRDMFNRSWLWETISCVAVLALSCAIIAVLVVYDNRPLPQLPFSVSLNAVISVLATALKGSLLIPTGACKYIHYHCMACLTSARHFTTQMELVQKDACTV